MKAWGELSEEERQCENQQSSVSNPWFRALGDTCLDTVFTSHFPEARLSGSLEAFPVGKRGDSERPLCPGNP